MNLNFRQRLSMESLGRVIALRFSSEVFHDADKATYIAFRRDGFFQSAKSILNVSNFFS